MVPMMPVAVLSPERTMLPALALKVPTRPVIGAMSVYQLNCTFWLSSRAWSAASEAYEEATWVKASSALVWVPAPRPNRSLLRAASRWACSRAA